MLFKAGKYYVGDPCYVIRNDEWDDILNHTQFFGCNGVGSWGGDWKGHRMFSASTAYGDGCYVDDEGRTYAVDAGMLGIVPYEYITEFGSIQGGQVIEFPMDFHVNASEGVFDFGHIHINTAGEYDEDDDYCPDCGGYYHDDCSCGDPICNECGEMEEECICGEEK